MYLPNYFDLYQLTIYHNASAADQILTRRLFHILYYGCSSLLHVILVWLIQRGKFLALRPKV